MAKCVCMFNHFFDGDENSVCPVCGTDKISIYPEADDPSGQTGKLSGKEPVRSGKKGPGVFSIVTLIVSVLIAVVGVVFFLMSRDRGVVDKQPTPVLTGVKLVLRERSSEGYTKEWAIEEGTVIPVRTWANLTIEAVPIPNDAVLPELELKVKEQEKLDVTKAPDGSGHDGAYRKLADVQVRNDNKDYGETGLEIEWKNGENTVHFALDIQRGGWNVVEGKYAFIDGTGAMRRNMWQQEGEHMRYLDAFGVAVVGWREINGKKYYFDEKARVVTGEQTIDGKTYWFDVDGALKE